MKVASFSVATVDYFPQADLYCPGGNALNQAVLFSRMGHECVFAGAVGTDPAGDRVEELLRREGVDLARLHRLPGRTATNQLVNDGTGERFSVEGSWDGGVYPGFRLGPEDWEYIGDCDVWTTHADCPSFSEALRRKRPDQRLCVDFLHLTDLDLIQRSLHGIDIAYFGGTPDFEPILVRLAAKFRIPLVLTLGAGGSIAFRGTQVYRQPALPVERVVDTTGCGDAFQAAFTAAWCAGSGLPECLLAGAEAGRRATLHHGARA